MTENAIINAERIGETPFVILENENNEFLISLGNQIVSEEKFKSASDAEYYVNSMPWQLIFNSIIYLINYIDDVKETIKKEGENDDK